MRHVTSYGGVTTGDGFRPSLEARLVLICARPPHRFNEALTLAGCILIRCLRHEANRTSA